MAEPVFRARKTGAQSAPDGRQPLPDDRQPVIFAALRTPLRRAHGALQHLQAHELLAPVLRGLLAGGGDGGGGCGGRGAGAGAGGGGGRDGDGGGRDGDGRDGDGRGPGAGAGAGGSVDGRDYGRVRGDPLGRGNARIPPAAVTDVVIGNAVGGGGNVARLAALEAGLPVSVPGITVDRQCGSGLDAIVLAARLVAAGGSGPYLAGGVESISTAPLRAIRTHDGDPEFFSRARFAPDTHGDPDMGVAAENVAVRYGISRARQDALALRSHRRALASAAAGVFDDEIVPVGVTTGPGGGVRADGAGRGTVRADDGPRRGLTAEVLARFPPAFVADGTVTAGNSCFDADGAAAVVLASLRRARELGARDGLLVLGADTAGVEPNLLGIGAAAAGKRLLADHALTAGDLGFVEFNEAFASQTIACLDQLGIDPFRANLDGGALALGHAYGASGAVLVTRLLAQARRDPVEGRLALALISIAGGMGTAALLEYRRFS